MDPERRTYNKHWIPWTVATLQREGVDVAAPLMPEPWTPVYERYKEAFERLPVYHNTVLIGHSCGCAFLVRWLGETKTRINKLILVAPWKINDSGKEEDGRFYDFEIDESIKDRVEDIVIFTADNEEEAGKESLKIFQSALEGEVINLENHGHYVLGDMRTEEFPELIEVIER